MCPHGLTLNTLGQCRRRTQGVPDLRRERASDLKGFSAQLGLLVGFGPWGLDPRGKGAEARAKIPFWIDTGH